MSDTIDVDDASDIAIIGMNCRFPGAGNVEEFWQNLVQGVESIARFEDDEILAAGVDGATLEDPAFVKAGGVLPDVDLFDAAFFGINPREAQVLDPQQRLLLECAWECLEHAGYDPAACPGLVGVYTGAAMSSYLGYVYGAPELVLSVGEMQVALGNDKDSIPTIVSYKLNLKGPSIAVQTACSTSLVAVGVACQSLLSYQCDLALAGGVRIVLPQAAGYLFQEGGILSPDGHCRAFDAGRAAPSAATASASWSSSASRTLSATATASTRSSKARPSTTTALSRSATRRQASKGRPRWWRWRWPPAASTRARSPTSRPMAPAPTSAIRSRSRR